MRHPRRLLGTAAIAAASALALAGCGLQPAGSAALPVAPGSIKDQDPGPGASVTVTSKQFTEQLILGKMGVLAAQAAGYQVTDLTNVPGSVPVRQLMLSGGATMTWEYTGTAWLTYLGHASGIPDKDEQFEAVRKADAKNGLTWYPPADENNTYALAVNADFEKRTGITTLSDIADIPVDDRTFCLDAEFNSRSDGFTPMLEHYGIDRGSADGVPDGNVKLFDVGAIYSATAAGRQCNFGEVYTTDGRIKNLDLTVLEDDEDFFPSYNVAPVLNSDLAREYPGLKTVYEKVASKLTNDVMIDLNLKVDVQGQDPADVAYDWMLKEGLITRP